ncbi:hypothetical protein ACLKA6_019629 [Drosophila palustris]
MTAITIEAAREKCGTVYTWNCAGELYGIECELCEERPLCPLNEFAEHMELWHSDWTHEQQQHEQQQQPPEEAEELMQEVLAEEQSNSGGEVNELKQQLVQELNGPLALALDTHSTKTKTTSQQHDHYHDQHNDHHPHQLLNLNEQRIQLGNNSCQTIVDNQQKLTTEHVQHLIELYRSETRLWNQTHPEFRNMELGRESWRQITNAWSAHCGRRFSVTDVRIRISTLCQRFLKQRERLEAEGEDGLEDGAKFVHYDQLRFLCEQQSLLKRREHFARENRKLLEIYEHYPILWHNAHKRLRCVETIRRRHEAHRGLQLALRMCGIKLSGLAIQRRLQSLRKRYRLEKIRYLHSVVEGKQSEFVATFEHYAEMEFLHKHIDPYVCAVCGKIFEHLVGHQAHVQGRCGAQSVLKEHLPQADTQVTVGELMVQLEMEGNRLEEGQQKIETKQKLEQVQQLEERPLEMGQKQLAEEDHAKIDLLERNLLHEDEPERNLLQDDHMQEDQFERNLLQEDQLERNLHEGIHIREDQFKRNLLERDQLQVDQLGRYHLEGDHLERYHLKEDHLQEDHLQEVHLQKDQFQRDHLQEDHLQGDHQLNDHLQKGFLKEDHLQENHLQEHQLSGDHLHKEDILEDHIQEDHIQENHLQENHLQEHHLPEHHLHKEDILEDHIQEDHIQEDHLQENHLQENYLQEHHLHKDDILEDHIQEDHLQENYIQEKASACVAAHPDEQLPLREEESSSTRHTEEASEYSQSSTNTTNQQANKLRVRLSLQQTNKLIELYQSHPNLWDPNHLDYHARKQRRQSWHNIAAELNDYSMGSSRYSWQMLHRKLTDYTKYYRRERQREALAEEGEGEGTRWSFYDAFSFLDDVLPISCVLQKSLQQRDSNLKIIQVYQSYEQLWCTNHPDYTKRKQRQRQLESLCTRLQEECNLQITVERLKNRLIEFRCQYRQCKESRQAALKLGVNWQPTYEYYQQLQFLELHVSPFNCIYCPASFKRRTDFLRHQRNVHLEEDELQGHLRKRRAKRGAAVNNPLEHICHICAMKFSLRTSLLAHLRRHLGQRTHACQECPKKFFNSTSLRVHQRSHTKELPYVCEHCARGFVNASKLNQHVKRHAEKRDYPCSRCDKAFYTAHERDRHLRAHLNIRDKVCPYCSRAFVVGSAYYAHLNLHRGEKRYSCSNCGQRFAQYAGLYKHRKRCAVTVNGNENR